MKMWTKCCAIALAVLASAARADDGDDAVVRMGGDVAVPLPERGPRAPEHVLITPAGGPAIARTEGGGFVVWDPIKGALMSLPLTGERLVAASPNGGSVLTGGADGKLTRWRIGTWKVMAELAVEGAVEEARFSADGHHIVVASDGPDGRRFTLFGGGIGLALKKMDRGDATRGAPFAVATSRFAFPSKERIAVQALPRFEGLRDVPLDSDDPVRALAFASETELVGVHDGHVLRWDTETGKTIGRIDLPDKCQRLALSGDGRLLVCAPIPESTPERAGPVVATIIDTTDGSVRTTFMVPGRGTPVFDPRGMRVAFPGNAALPIWEVTIDGVSTVLPAGSVAGRVLQLHIVGSTVVALEDGYLRAWDPASRAEAWRVATTATSIGPLRDGRIVLAGAMGLAIYNPQEGTTTVVDAKKKLAAIATQPTSDVIALLDPEGRVFVRAPGDKRALVAMPAVPRPKRGMVSQRGTPGVLALSWDGGHLFAEGRLANLPPDKRPQATLVAKHARLAAWRGRELVTVVGDEVRIDDRVVLTRPGIVAMSASTDGQWLVLGTNDGRVIALAGDKVRLERVAHRGAVTALAIDIVSGRVYSAGEDGAHSLVLGWALPR